MAETETHFYESIYSDLETGNPRAKYSNQVPPNSGQNVAYSIGAHEIQSSEESAEQVRPSDFLIWSVINATLCVCGVFWIVALPLSLCVNRYWEKKEYKTARILSRCIIAWNIFNSIVCGLLTVGVALLVVLITAFAGVLINLAANARD